MFCPECGSIIVNKKGKLVCSSCGYEVKEGKIKDRQTKKVDKTVKVAKENPEVLPKIKAKCPKCGNEEAYFWVVQTRAADEAPTRFYKCTKCGHVWREYD
ncbi:MAG: transcription factor S [Nanoarchaeota archaeon]|nr:transcription factor S [Nanoarchaeota archaeon]